MSEKTGLIGDIGGTNARFALADGAGIREEKTLKCADYEGLSDAVRFYLEELGYNGKIEKALFCVAGPVKGDRFEMTNLPWAFSVEETRKTLGFEALKLLNDFEALALGVPHLKPGEFRQVSGGTAQEHAPIGVTGPGTGLGMASLFWDGAGYRAAPGEGGHVTMPARTQREFDIFAVLRAKYRHVSAERVCSGKGLVNVYNALRSLDGLEDQPDRTPEAISAAALDKSCPLCVEALDLMMGFLGTVAGNLALTIGAQGGIYLVGSILNPLGTYFDYSRFREEFERKGRFEDYLQAIPTYVIAHEYPAFLGLYHELMREA